MYYNYSHKRVHHSGVLGCTLMMEEREGWRAWSSDEMRPIGPITFLQIQPGLGWQWCLLTFKELVQSVVCVTHNKHWCSLLTGTPESLVGQQSLGDFKANVGLSYRRIRNVVTAKK